MGWPHCFKMHQNSSSTTISQTGQATQTDQQQHQTQHQQLRTPAWPQSRRPVSTEQDKQSAQALKEEGNTYFGKAKYGAAIEKYTEALTLCPDWSVLLVNRAMCQKKKEAWNLVLQDAEAAISIDSQLMKAHYLLGLALRHTQRLQESIQHLKQALEGARQKDDNIKDEIWHELAQVQYLCWEQESAAALQKQQLLQGRMHHLLQQQRDHELAAQEVSDLDQVFESARHSLKAGEPAAAFTCPLTMEVFRDPVMTPSGLSYERSALVEHLRKVGAFDPITREALTASQLIPNIALRNATLQYLEEHPWAWSECC